MRKRNVLIVSGVLSALAAPALAHSGHGETSGLIAGLMHPVLGPDHLLAMLAVGLWSGFVLPRRFWLGAVVFMTAMAAGAGLSWAGLDYPMVEPMIVLSVVLFGFLTLVSRRGQPDRLTLASLIVIGVFASAHGHAHATEAAGNNALAYLAGFLVATGGLHLAGIALAHAVAAQPLAQRIMGGGIAASGLWLAFG
ncbi:urease accessory protein [Roseovarius sp. MBR-78]|uniref:HupE/UreJ family protein n=1 Tax=Roseovarius sp. MBR-78 TaxID=3156460 RepID=UPI003390CA57